jgi:hypothetical protein
MFDRHPAFDAVADMENEVSRATGLVNALHQLIGDEIDEDRHDEHEAMFTVCTVMRETIEKLDEKWKKAWDATKLLTP